MPHRRGGGAAGAAGCSGTVSASQVAYIVPPSTAYPARSRKAGEQGRVRLMVLVDIVGQHHQPHAPVRRPCASTE